MSESGLPVLGALDRPTTGQVVDGLTAVGGWAHGPSGGRVEITLDGEPIDLHLEWYPRPDVDAWLVEHGHEVPGGLPLGFVGMLDTATLADGHHEIGCRLALVESVQPVGNVVVIVGNLTSDYGSMNGPGAAEPLRRDQIYGSGPPVEVAAAQVLSLIVHYGEPPFLDVGCGIGAYVEALAKLGHAITGLEIEPEYVARAREAGRNVVEYSGERIPFEDDAFGTAFAIEVLEHVPAWRRTLAEMLRVSRDSVLISVPNLGVLASISRHGVVPWHLLESTHVNFFSPRILGNALDSTPGLSSKVFTYGSIRVNGETFDNHVFAVVDRKGGAA